MVYVLVLKRRFGKVKSAVFAVLFSGGFCLLQIAAGELPLYLWIPGMIAAMVTMHFCIFALCKVNTVNALFWTTKAFVLAEFAAAVEWQLYYFYSQRIEDGGSIWVQAVFLILIYAVIFFVAVIFERRYSKGNRKLNITGKHLLSSAVIAITVFFVGNLSFITRSTPFSGQYETEIYYIRTLVDFIGLLLLLAQQEQQLWLHAKLEVGVMQNILSRQYEQYVLYKDNTELLNRRYHDLKNQIAAIKAEKNPAKKAGYLDEMETGIKMYEAQNKTGNSVLDTILTSKSMFCVQNDINMTCVADGTLLHFIDIMDICSIFGNAVDNAIESVMHLSDPEKRLIKIAVFAQNNLMMVRFENYMENNPRFEDGLPVTTKNKKENHGYGIKSIKLAAEKYGGSIKIDAADNWFSLCLLIPMTDE
jgi:hypothetical protein